MDKKDEKIHFALLSILFPGGVRQHSCSSDDEDSGNPSKSSDSANNNKDTTIESYSYTGVSKYQKFVVDSAVATLSKRGRHHSDKSEYGNKRP